MTKGDHMAAKHIPQDAPPGMLAGAGGPDA